MNILNTYIYIYHPVMRETWVQSLGQKDPLEINGNPLQYSCLGNSMDWKAWQTAVHGVAKSRIQLSDWTDWLTERMVGFPWWLSSKESACNAGDTEDAGLIPGSERFPGGGNGNPLQYSCLGNPTDRGVWQAIVHGVAKSWTWLSD